MTESASNLLYYGDNLDILRRYVKDETVELVYLDPRFQLQCQLQRPFRRKRREQGCKSDSGFLGHLDMDAGKRIRLCGDRDGGRACG
jgi:hypothetical protein